MKKRILSIGIAIVMLFAVVGMVGCELNNPTLAEYRATAIIALEAYAGALDEEAFSKADWGRIEGYVESGIDAIKAATTKPGVDAALNTAKSNIGGVVNGVNVGITAEIEARIMQTIFEHLRKHGYNQHITVADIRISTYGYYNGAVALNFWHIADGEPPLGDEPWFESVGGIEFIRDSGCRFIVIWHNDNLFSITEAFYEYEILTVEDLIEIQVLVN